MRREFGERRTDYGHSADDRAGVEHYEAGENERQRSGRFGVVGGIIVGCVSAVA